MKPDDHYPKNYFVKKVPQRTTGQTSPLTCKELQIASESHCKDFNSH